MLSTFCSLFVCVRCSVRLRLLRWFQLLLSFSFKYFLDLVISLYSLDFLLLLLFCFFKLYLPLVQNKGEALHCNAREVHCTCKWGFTLWLRFHRDSWYCWKLWTNTADAIAITVATRFPRLLRPWRCGRNCNCDHGRIPFFKTFYESLKRLKPPSK